MDELRRNGNVKAIGLGVNENKVCLEALEIGDWDVFLLAGRYTLLEQTPLDTLFPACRKSGTTIICGGPFNSGILAGRDMWNYAKAPADVVEKVRKLSAEADAFSVPLPAAALQFPLANDIVTSVIPGPRDTGELQQIVDWVATPIPGAFWESLRDKRLIAEDAPVPEGR
jgi:D-threo-aldose 1-dehydrogenase